MVAHSVTHSHFVEKVSKLKVSIMSLPSETVKTCRRVGGKSVGVREMEDSRSIWTTESTKQGSYGLKETEVASMGTAMV